MRSKIVRKGVILVVEDEFQLRGLLREILLDLTPHVLVAENGKVALDILAAQDVHAVLTDITMPVLGGFALLQETRKLGLDIPFVFATGLNDVASLLTAIRLGAVDFIEKPFDAKTVFDVMQKVLEFGLDIKDVEAELDNMFFDTRYTSEDLLRFRNMRRVALMMNLDCNIFARRKMG